MAITEIVMIKPSTKKLKKNNEQNETASVINSI